MLSPGSVVTLLSTSGREQSVRRYRALLERLDLSSQIQYSTFVSEGLIDPEEFVAAIRDPACPCLGAAISKDIKSKVIPYLDELDESASAVSSVNTVVNNEGRLVGYNTDYIGFRLAIAAAVERSACVTAVVYGYGGVTYVVCECLQSLGILKENIFISGRNMEKANQRAQELGVSVWTPDTSIDLFVNSAPVTDQPLEEAENLLAVLLPVSTGPPSVVFDHEMPGQCLQDWVSARNSDGKQVITYVSGYEMYYPQMKAQWKLFLGKHVQSSEAIESTLQALIDEEKA